ncbi:MAG: RIP metalloprotease RseP [Prochlorococcus sp.]|nr:RIP metalloprotease RseP [Prochlorococcaceae cyanobacterium Fu_MAG_50]
MNVLAALAVLGLLIVIHEAGHFLAATAQGIHVNGFSIGFGPALIKRQRRGVTYAIRALPLGGFVSFPDDDEDSEIPEDDPDLLKNRPLPQRALVISAGVLANLMLAWLVLVGQVAFAGLPEDPDPGVLIMAIQPGEAAAEAGLAPGDQILGIDGHGLGQGQVAVQAMVEQIKSAPDRSLQLERMRAGERSSITLRPADHQGQGQIGAQLQANVTGKTRSAENPAEILGRSSSEFFNLFSRTVKGYAGLVTNFGSTAQQMSGPVKIVEMGAQLTSQGSAGLVLFTALISINLGVLNALPLPLLDGGQMLMLVLEGIRGKPVPERFQMAFMQSGFLLLVGLSLVLIVKDTSQLNVIQQLIGR